MTVVHVSTDVVGNELLRSDLNIMYYLFFHSPMMDNVFIDHFRLLFIFLFIFIGRLVCSSVFQLYIFIFINVCAICF